jgi:hypothetical protein
MYDSYVSELISDLKDISPICSISTLHLYQRNPGMSKPPSVSQSTVLRIASRFCQHLPILLPKSITLSHNLG